MGVEPALRVGWWNTGLSPHKRSQKPLRKDGLRWSLTKDTVRELLSHADLLILGEIEIESLFVLCPDGFEYLPRQGANPTRMGVLYDPRRVIVRHQPETRIIERNRELKLREFVLKHVDVERTIEVLGVHFPSHLHEHQEDLRRSFASALNRQIKARRGGAEDSHLVIIGDFNDEPFSYAVHTQLRGVRERTLVFDDTSRELLYNPFWRKLGERHPAGQGAPVFGPAGTYFYEKNRANGQRWYTYDQLLVTAAFLSGAGWTLDEHGVDHLPIIGKFSYLPERGTPQ